MGKPGWSIYSLCQVTAISSEGFTVILKSIIRDEGSGDSKPGDNVPKELFDVHIPDIRQSLSFNPLSEIISVDQQIPLIRYCFSERPHNIQTSLSERPRAGQGIKDSS